jgi:hypothetical protein
MQWDGPARTVRERGRRIATAYRGIDLDSAGLDDHFINIQFFRILTK